MSESVNECDWSASGAAPRADEPPRCWISSDRKYCYTHSQERPAQGRLNVKLNVEWWKLMPDGTYHYQCLKGVDAVRVTKYVDGEDWPETLGVFGVPGDGSGMPGA